MHGTACTWAYYDPHSGHVHQAADVYAPIYGANQSRSRSDCKVDLSDFAALSSVWLSARGDVFDLADDPTFDNSSLDPITGASDLEVLAEYWGPANDIDWGNPPTEY